jgi:hypothetical protein
VRFRKLINRAALCALVACILMMSGIANPSFGGLINDPAANYLYDWSEYFTSTRPSTAGLTYGTPQVLSKTVLDFANNLQFSSVSGGATPSDFVDGKLVVDITAKDGFGIDGITLFERGTYSFGLGGSAATTQAKVQLIGATLNVTAINGTALGTPYSIPGTMLFQPSLPGSKTFAKITDPDAGDWSGTMLIANIPALMNLSAGQRVTSAKLIFDNQLETITGASSHSFIDKKDLQLSIIPTPVPEPSTLVLLGMGGLFFVFLRKRKRLAR